MPGENLTRVEAQDRKAIVDVASYEVVLDLTAGRARSSASTTTVDFHCDAGLIHLHRRDHGEGSLRDAQRRRCSIPGRSATASASSSTISPPRTCWSSSRTPCTRTPARACTGSSTRSTARCTCTRNSRCLTAAACSRSSSSPTSRPPSSSRSPLRRPGRSSATRRRPSPSHDGDSPRPGPSRRPRCSRPT